MLTGLMPIPSTYTKQKDGGQTWQIIVPNDNSICGIGSIAWFPDKIVQSVGQFQVCILDIDALLQVKAVSTPATKKIMVYPNPAKNILKISEPIQALTLVDVAGKVLSHYEHLNEIDISNLQKGIYFLNITTEKGIKQVLKVLKE